MKNIRDKIAQDRLKEVFGDLAILFEGKYEDLYDQNVLIQARFKKHERAKILGTISTNEANAEHANIVNAVLNLLREYEDCVVVASEKQHSELSEADLSNIKADLKAMIDELRFDEVFEVIAENEKNLHFDKSLFSTLQNDFLHKGSSDPLYCKRFKAFIGTFRRK